MRKVINSIGQANDADLDAHCVLGIDFFSKRVSNEASIRNSHGSYVNIYLWTPEDEVMLDGLRTE